MSGPRLRTEDLSVGYNGTPVLRGLDLEVEAGEVVVLLGRNGAGKTTTLHTIAGLIPIVEGDVELDGAPVRGPLHRRVRQGLGLVTEERMIIRRLTVLENLRLAASDPSGAWEIFPELEPLKHRRAGLLSGGEQQMLVLARTLLARPQMLLVDELSFGLAPMIVARLLEALLSAAHGGGAGILLVEQHAMVALEIADRGYVISQGGVSMSGTGAELRERLDEIERSYLAEPVAD
jgi:branched-chain amino acid transport system ATP-binding protein